MIELVCLGHHKEVGKDTLAQQLAYKDGYIRLAFAQKMKSIMQDLYGFNDEQLHGNLKSVIDPRYGLSPREMMQRFGTEAIRRQVWDKTWTNYLLNNHMARLTSQGHTKFVISDLRFQNEFNEVLAWGKKSGAHCTMIKITRPSLGENADSHQSETELDSADWDAVLCNDKRPEDLYESFWHEYLVRMAIPHET